MELATGILMTVIGLFILLFNDKLIELFNSDKYYSHKQNRYGNIAVGITAMILGIWAFLQYFGLI